MARTRKNTTNNTNNTNNNMKGETMNKSIKDTLTITLTKKGYSTVVLTQINGAVIYTVNGIPCTITNDQGNALYKAYIQKGFKVKADDAADKTLAPKTPKTEKTAEEKKAERDQKLTTKYGDIEVRRAYVQKRNAIWAEESAKIAEAVKNGTMKRLRKDEWKKLMNERVNARMVATVA